MQRGGYRSRGQSRGRGRGGSSVRLNKGLFDGVWKCNCTPRLPAEHFKVKKEGKNQGRWFYTCQHSEPNRCGFFLWEEDATPREAAAVLSNSRQEPQAHASRVSHAQDEWTAGQRIGGMVSTGRSTPAIREDSETQSPTPTPPTPASSAKPSSTSLKRSARTAEFDDDDDLFGLTGIDEAELAHAAEGSLSAAQTPQKIPRIGAYATPATTERKSARRLPWLDPLATPSIAKKTVADYFATPSKAPAGTVHYPSLPSSSDDMPETPQAQPTLAVPPTTIAPASPSPPTRYKDALSDPADSASSLTSEVLAALSATNVPFGTLSSVRSVVSKHDLRTQGIVKGRDIARLALKAKDAKIRELEARIASLEVEKECSRGVIQKLRWDKDHGQEEDDDDGEL